MSILELNDVHAYYGKIHALKGISLKVEKGEIVTLIGGNGAGKTTTLRTISALMRPTTGSVTFEDESLTRYKPSDLAARGIAMVPEGRGVFARMTVLENLEMGAFHRNDKAGIAQDVEMVYDLFPRLKERRTQLAGTMSGGEQQMLAMGRALMSRPRLLLLDEPSMGLAPVLVEAIFSTVVDINKQGTTVLLVEQNALMALDIASRGYVLQTGEIVLSDDAKALQKNEMIQKVYLGIE
ncbi:MAG: ABC transporter ATP-binding protein [Anaerolineae bacterium]|uniref:ABC transporter ATP-binding protein n=1 Tax=Promineifilum sp. TaxID=2664178 RepID=UPI001DA6AA4F|nr:ABC transporter ATP-binding protein [Anaerolineales bacterium]MCB8935569.1 ABC transporter ATP-binding protein [Promineifilum sp.]MCO5180634.1 ABC transporter ATP-binding protein [Promineifilum sp.]MCW5847639.1 ABC transporter ATP-binding protein [Anaerolineae bacterium]